jgi:hypothetical protein
LKFCSLHITILRFCDFCDYSIFEDLAIFHVLAIVGFAWVVKEVPFQSEKKSKKKLKKKKSRKNVQKIYYNLFQVGCKRQLNT